MCEDGKLDDVVVKKTGRTISNAKSALDSVHNALSLGRIELVAQAYKDFLKAASRLDNDVSALVLPCADDGSGRPAGAGEPLPDRLRQTLADLIVACVPDVKDRFIALRLLALDGDGITPTLAEIGEAMGVTRERIRQRRNRAFAQIVRTAPRRIASCQRIRIVQRDIAPDCDWSDPYQAARYILRLLSDHVPAARHLAAISCLAAGWHGKVKQLLEATATATQAVARSIALEQHWRLDAWVDASALAIFPADIKSYGEPPRDMMGRKREPGEVRDGTHLFFNSAKLGRVVACESVSEYRVMSWLEKTPDVVWYKEQPIAVPYRLHNHDRRYFHDVAVIDCSGRGLIVEVKPIYGMYREQAFAKSLACLDFVGSRGMGYLIVDQNGRSLSDYAHIPYSKALAEEIEKTFERSGTVHFREVRAIFQRHRGKIPLAEFVSMVVNRDWAITEGPVMVGRLDGALSFRRLVARHR